MDDYVDAERDEPRGPGGVIPCPILDDVSIFTALKDDPEKRFWRCVGAVNGCTTTWVIPRVKGRVLKHAATCRYISADLQQKVNEELGDDAPGARVARNALNQSVSQSAVPAAHGTIQSAGGSQPSVYEMSKLAWYEMLDYEILKFMCCSGMPPHVLNLKEWKSMWACAVPKYKPVSGSNMEDTQVPREAARIRVLALQYLQTCERLTISFDGGTTRRPQSVYTMHVTTEDKKVFLWAGDEASAESHTADHIYQILKAVIDIIGPHRFRGISSDNTGNTTGARNRIHSDYPWILILPDPCHRLNLLCNDICKIPYFKPHIKNLRRTVKYFKKSTFASAHLRIRRKKLKIRRGLKSIGKTRFGTIYHSGRK
ncbi:hypothetical protein BD410DRAFT_482841 [Rickenella mellea]|uniref:DUF659 domain-containing protein n=1 Tax=Rickenella mellea TaxID=50990 RepID=A0A4Y7QHA7_9AGAM|nr:hypothetical protein BD410DRAFT_482841 [Rickenella mellea]